MGKHTKRYMLVANIRGKEKPLFPVYGLERAEVEANKLRRHHPISVRDMETGAIMSNAVEVIPISVVNA